MKNTNNKTIKYSNTKWPLEKLGKVCDVRDGTHESPKYLPTGIPFITSKNLKSNHISFENVRFISRKDHQNFSKRSKVDNGDVLFGMIGTIGNPVVVTTDRVFSIKNIALFKFKDNQKLLNYFLQILLNSQFTKKTLMIKARGGSQKFISLTNLRNFKIPMPSMDEQKRIVEILSKWDQAIEKLEKLISAKKKQFKWLLKTLINDQKNNPNWKKVKIGDICKIKKGVQLNKLDMISTGKYPVLNGGVDFSGHTDKWNTTENTITISEGGNSCGYVNWNIQKFWAGGHCYTINNIKKEKFNALFLYYQLKTNERRIMKLRVGSGLPNIQKCDIEKFPLMFPILPEQKRIAKILHTAQKEVEKLKSLKRKYQEQKKRSYAKTTYWSMEIKINYLNYTIKL